MKKILFVLSVLAIVSSCDCSKEKEYKIYNRQLENAVLFTQHAPEYKALTFQAYNIAQFRILEMVQKKSPEQKLAVVLDIDETVLDNSPYAAQQLLSGISYPMCWDEWCEKEVAELIPGVGAFLNFSDSIGVKIFYVSNRKEHLREATKNNLKKHQLPQTDDASILLRSEESSKENRRNSILSLGYEIALLIGDNLADFSFLFDDKDIIKRTEYTIKNKDLFGDRFIVIPNISYGSWEGSLGLYDKINQDSLRRTLFNGFECDKTTNNE